MTSIMKIVKKAMKDVSTYKHPDLTEFRQVLTPIVDILKCGDGGKLSDRIDNISMYDGYLYIDVSWSTRGCIQNSTMKIPLDVLENTDPVKYANIKKLKEDRKKLVLTINSAKYTLADAEAKLKEISDKLSSFKEDFNVV